MRHHQKYLSVEDAEGKLAPHFIAVMNTTADPDGLVRQGNERVLRARFNDARFFWDQDQKKKLEDRVEDLKNVTFQAKLGSYYEKTQRVVALVKELGGSERAALLLASATSPPTWSRSSPICKASSAASTRARKANPKKSRRPSTITTSRSAWKTQFPSTASGPHPEPGRQVRHARECFKVGMMPTGSKDPFGLRRAAQGVVRIIVEGKMKFDFRRHEPELANFLRDRVEYYFRDVRGFAYDEVRACMAAGWTDLHRSGSAACSASKRSAPRPTSSPSPPASSASEYSEAGCVLQRRTHWMQDLFEAGPGTGSLLRDRAVRHGPTARIAESGRCGRRSICSSTKCW